MKAPTYTDEQIIDAGMKLLAENKRVSPFGVLPNKGTKRDIGF